jgi:hypothetical protein
MGLGKILAIIAIIGLGLESAHAEIGFDLSSASSPYRATLTQSVVPARSAGEGGWSYGESDFSFKGSFSFYRDSQLEGGKLSATSYFVQPSFDRRSLTGLGSIGRDATLYTEGASVGALHFSTSKEAYFFGLGILRSGEAGPSGASLWIPSAYAIGTHHFNSDTALLYGAAFTTAFGIFLPVPVLGVTSKLSKDWSLTAILPILTQLNWRPLAQWNFAAFLKGSGFESKIANEGRFASPDSSIEIKSRAFQMGVGAGYDASHLFSIQGEVAALAARQLKFEDASGTLLTQKLNPSPIALTISATARFNGAP